ncbi:MAG: hypothetical protein U5Q03_02140 [Bacteroidota bacterium]|nr:hypothetical protein [Bacteroidota bacterium]
MNTQMTEKESLKIIYEMIETSKLNIKGDAIFFLLWGWLVLIASIAHFILEQMDYAYSFLPWPLMMIGGGIASGIIGYHMGQRNRTITLIDKTMIYLWCGFFALVVSMIVITTLGKMSWGVTQPMIVALYSLATFVSGVMLRFRPLILGAVFSWFCAIAIFFVAFPYSQLLIALSIIVSYLIPGYMLKYKREE